MHATPSIVRYQFLPFRDRSGRRILTVFPDEELEQMEPSVRVSLSRLLLASISLMDDPRTAVAHMH
jgi:hypothetical protein